MFNGAPRQVYPDLHVSLCSSLMDGHVHLAVSGNLVCAPASCKAPLMLGLRQPLKLHCYQKLDRAYQESFTALCHMHSKSLHDAGDVKEFGFRPIPEDGNYASHFSGDTSTPKADSGNADHTFSDSRPADSDPDLIDLGQGGSQGSEQEPAGDTREAIDKAISDADSASKHRHPHLHHRHHHQQQQQQGEPHTSAGPPLLK